MLRLRPSKRYYHSLKISNLPNGFTNRHLESSLFQNNSSSKIEKNSAQLEFQKNEEIINLLQQRHSLAVNKKDRIFVSSVSRSSYESSSNEKNDSINTYKYLYTPTKRQKR